MQEQKVEAGKLYKVELSRVVKKQIGKKNKIVRQIAPEGKIFLVVLCKEPSKFGTVTYTKTFPILLGTPQDRIDEMAEQLYLQLKKQYSL